VAGGYFIERILGQHLEGYIAVQYFIPRAINDTHAAFANLLKDSVVIQRLSDHGIDQQAMLSRSLTAPET
jgi:hypothetical protein